MLLFVDRTIRPFGLSSSYWGWFDVESPRCHASWTKRRTLGSSAASAISAFPIRKKRRVANAATQELFDSLGIMIVGIPEAEICENTEGEREVLAAEIARVGRVGTVNLM